VGRYAEGTKVPLERSREEIERVVGANVRARRKARGWTLGNLSARVALAVSFLSDIERGKAAPSLHSLMALSRAFGCLPEELLTGHATRQEIPCPRCGGTGTVTVTVSGGERGLMGRYVDKDAAHKRRLDLIGYALTPTLGDQLSLFGAAGGSGAEEERLLDAAAEELDEVKAAFIAAHERGEASVDAWLRKCPQHAPALLDLAFALDLEAHRRDEPGEEEVGYAAGALRDALQQVRDERARSGARWR
jgi:DNA-binding XRE family transcriptional regulator